MTVQNAITYAQTKQRIQQTLASGWRLTPATFAYKVSRGRWIPAPHLMYMSSEIAPRIAAGGARILVMAPPRHGKSEFLSVNTPAWFLERWPRKNVIATSYALELATEFSLKVRTMFLNEDNHHLLRTRLCKDKLRIDRFLTTEGGGLTAAGIGGPITGRGADLLLVDDYIKNAEQAMSKSQRDSMWEWFRSTAWTRLEPGASVVILATRWDVDDLIGRCLTEMPNENWLVINLPAIARPGGVDLLGRSEGEALWPDRYDDKELSKIKDVLGSYWWEAMYQQNPRASMSEALIGDKLKFISESEVPHYSELKILRAWDLAATEGGGDYTAGPKCAVHKTTNRFYILDMRREQKSPGNVEQLVKNTAISDGAHTPVWLEQEPGSAGKIVIAHYQNDVLEGFEVHGEKSTGLIEVRATPFLAGIEAGNVYAVKADWNKALKDELNAFPEGDHDDQISACSLAYEKLVRNKFLSVVWGRYTTPGQREAHLERYKYSRAAGLARRGRVTW